MARRLLARPRDALLAGSGTRLGGAIERVLRHTALRAGVAVAYHRVGSTGGDPARELDPALDAAVLEGQLAHLTARYRLVPASRLAAAVRMRRRGERFPVAVTFDDDLASHATHAAPALQRAGAPATFFLCGASLDGPHAFWWDRLQRALDRGVDLPPPADAHRPIRATGLLVEELPAAERQAFAECLAELAGPDPDDSGIRAEQVTALAAAGLEIGFHTRGHHRLTQLGDEDLARELREGAEQLAGLAGGPLETIAYPHGRADDRVAAAAAAAGYRAGFTTEPRAVTPTSDPLRLGRLGAPLDSVGRLAFDLARTLARALTAGPESGRGAADARRAALGERTGRAARRLRARPRVGGLDMGRLRTTEPLSRDFGFDRGTPVDRRYIEAFMERHAADVRGRVLEVGDDGYTRRFGGGRVDHVDVLHAAEGNPQATIVADLADAPELPDATWDCAIATQTLLLVYDVRAAVATLHRVLRPGGVALVTLPGVSRLCAGENDPWGDYWRFTSMSARRLFEEEFGVGAVEVEAFGNVLTATAQLHGIAAEELEPGELDARDPSYEVLIAVRARRASTA
ncbi:MAG: hypothetical protein QOK25_1391 [Thermoleophilaceae bacterium]|nr:hypothetical protein [Thermoleophilaceae bacterium]